MQSARNVPPAAMTSDGVTSGYIVLGTVASGENEEAVAAAS